MLVAPHTGAWIEIGPLLQVVELAVVAPHTGAWIEIPVGDTAYNRYGASHPTRVRGLKLTFLHAFVL